MKENKGFMSDVVRIFSITIAILCGVVLPNTVKAAQEFNEDVMFSSAIVNEPSETWTQDEWNEYKRAVEDKLGAQETAYYFSLNGKPFSGYKLYYQEGGSYSPDNLISNTPELEEISTLEGFPGVYVFNTSKKENDSDYYPYGYFRIYKESATLVGEIEYSLYYDSIDVSSKDCKEKKFYSIEFEQGDIDCRALPETKIVEAGEGIRLESLEETNVCIGGYIFKDWEDRDGNVVELYNAINSHKVLHPTYANETSAIDYNGSSYPYLYALDNYSVWESKAAVNIDEGDSNALLSAITDSNQSYVIIDGDTSLTADNTSGTIYVKNDCIIVKAGATLTLDNIKMNYSSHTWRITIQEGGKIVVKNDTNLGGFHLGIHKGGTLEVHNANLSYNSLYNYGDIIITKDDDSFRAMSANAQYFCNYNNDAYFLNGITGTIDVTNARFRTYDVLVRDRSTVNNINKGKISLHGTGCLYMDGDDFNQAGTDTKKASFINEGIIEVVDVVENSDYYYRNLYMEHIKLNNFGTINIVPQTIQIGEGREFIYQTAIAYCYDVEINNYGKLNVNNSKLKGIEINGKYQDTVEGLEGPSSIRNYPSGVITMTSGEGAIALDLGANCALYNSGNLKIDTTGTGMVNHATITSRGTINNTGTIINNGYIGFYRNYEVKNMGYSGDMFTGTGGFSCSVGILAKDENDSSINTDYTVTIDGSINKNSFEGFLPLSTVIPVKVEAVGYNTYMGSITTYSTLEDYITAATDYKNHYNLILKKTGNSTTDRIDESKTNTPVTNIPGTTGSGVDYAIKGSIYTVNNIRYMVIDEAINGTGKVTVVGVIGKTGKVTIDSTVNIGTISYKITAISSKAFKGNTALKTVIIGEYVSNIGSEAFSGCTKLATINIGSSVTTIGKKAFYNCKAAKNVKITTKKLKSNKIGKNAFGKMGSKKYSKLTIKVDKLKVKGYKTAFRKSGLSSKVTVKKY